MKKKRLFVPSSVKSNPLNRRQFVGVSALGALGLMLPSCENEDEVLFDPSFTPPDFTRAIVIGTGFGGAVAALRLGESGVPTTVLERGRRWNTPGDNVFASSFSPDGRSTWLRTQTVAPLGPVSFINKYVGVLERLDFDNMQVYNGAGVGGGSIVYGGMTVQPTEENFYQIFPSDIDYSDLDVNHYPRVRQMLNAFQAPLSVQNSDQYTFAEIFDQQAAAAGLTTELIDQAYDWDIIQQEIDGLIDPDVTNGELIYGNNNGCKNSLDHNYLPAAEATGNVNIYPLHQVKEIGQLPDERYYVTYERINSEGEALETRTITCKYLFMAAGSVGTSKLLVKAKETGTLPGLNSQTGQGWGSNGNSMFMRSFVGVPTGTLQANPPIRALQHFENDISPVLIENAPFPIGGFFPGIDCFCLLHLGVAIHTSRGQFTYNGTTDNVNLNWPANGNDQAVAAISQTAGLLNQANGGIIDIGWFPEGFTKDFTYHPLGGMVLGEACDFFGRIEGYNHLYVIDGAMIPGSTACANPSLTIAALAERNIIQIISEDIFPGEG